MNGLLDRCIACGMIATKPGAGICLRCEILALIDLSYERMMERLKGNIPAQAGRKLTKSIKRLQMTSIQTIKGE